MGFLLRMLWPLDLLPNLHFIPELPDSCLPRCVTTLTPDPNKVYNKGTCRNSRISNWASDQLRRPQNPFAIFLGFGLGYINGQWRALPKTGCSPMKAMWVILFNPKPRLHALLDGSTHWHKINKYSQKGMGASMFFVIPQHSLWILRKLQRILPKPRHPQRLHGRHQQPILWPLLSQPPNQNPSIKATSHINIKNQIPCNPHKYMSVEHPWIIFLCNHVSHGGFLCMSMVHYTYIWQRYGAGPGNWTHFLANSAQTAANSIQLTHTQTAPLHT